MTLTQAFILGLVQGITEYLPVSSSAHLVLVPVFLGWNISESNAFLFDVLVQLGTLLGVILYFAKDLMHIASRMLVGLRQSNPLVDTDARLGWLVILATIPAAVGGIVFKEHVQSYFASPRAVMAFLLVTAGFLILAEFLGRMRRKEVRTGDALSMGIAQVAALLPGVSRSGSTIAAGVLSGLSRESAARFSFLMSIPIMIGASIVASRDLFSDLESVSHLFLPLLVGMTTAAISGYFVIRWFLGFLKTRSLLWFALYCAVLGGGGLIFYG